MGYGDSCRHYWNLLVLICPDFGISRWLIAERFKAVMFLVKKSKEKEKEKEKEMLKCGCKGVPKELEISAVVSAGAIS